MGDAGLGGGRGGQPGAVAIALLLAALLAAAPAGLGGTTPHTAPAPTPATPGGTVPRTAPAVAPAALGDAAPYAVLARGPVTGTGTVTGDVGGAPVAGPRVTGAVRTGDALVQPLADLDEADDTLASATVTGDRVGARLAPGVYRVDGALDVGPLVLDARGDPDAGFVVEAGSLIARGPVTLADGARACRVFWLVDGPATIDAAFVGTAVARSGLTAGPGARVTGRVLSRGAVRVDGAVDLPDDCP